MKTTDGWIWSHIFLVMILSAGVVSSSGCFVLLPSRGGGEARFEPPRQVNPDDVLLPPDYQIEVIATGLDIPTAVTFDQEGRIYVTEAGYSYGDLVTTPRLVRIEPDGSRVVIAEGDNPPWNGVTFHDGAFFVAGGHIHDGEILRVTPQGEIDVLVDGLPSLGDHHTNSPVVGPDGFLYFGQGTATNSGVVGIDNYHFGWLTRYPDFHDIPCEDITLVGKNYTTKNPLTPDRNDEVTTGAFVPFGTVTEEGQVIQGQVPCNGAIFRIPVTGGDLDLVAWGLRNPFGLAWGPDGRLYATENHYDVRGSRPVFGTGDLLWRIEPGVWYGWPDYYAGLSFEVAEWVKPPGEPDPELLLQHHPGEPPRPVGVLGVHTSSNGIDFSRSEDFGNTGQAFIAQFGDMADNVGKVLAPAGFKVIRVNTENGRVEDFAANRGKVNGPASWLNSGGLERPLGVRFDPTGTALYIVDFGVMTIHEGQVYPRLGTGVLWRVTRKGRGAP